MRKPLRNLLATSTVLLIAACNSSAPPAAPPSAAPAVSQTAAHDHDHGHSHEVGGPNGGHLIELGDEEYHLEWTHDDAAGVVALYVLDGAVKKFVPIASESITITAKVTDSIDYNLTAVEPIGDPPVSAKFELKSPELIECLKLAGRGTDVSVAVTIDGKEYRGEFEHHEHGHAH